MVVLLASYYGDYLYKNHKEHQNYLTFSKMVGKNPSKSIYKNSDFKEYIKRSVPKEDYEDIFGGVFNAESDIQRLDKYIFIEAREDHEVNGFLQNNRYLKIFIDTESNIIYTTIYDHMSGEYYYYSTQSTIDNLPKEIEEYVVIE